jgi:DNA anti-recombination protein RmuC
MATKKQQPVSLSVVILRQIRDEMRGMRAELRDEIAGLRREIVKIDDQTTARLDEANRLRAETEMRLATVLTALAGDMHEVRKGILEIRAEQMNKFEERLRAIEAKLAS